MDELRSALSNRDCEMASTQLVITNLKVDNESYRNESLQLRDKLIQLVKLVTDMFLIQLKKNESLPL